MIYPSDLEIRLGFDRIRTMIERNTTTQAAKDLLAGLTFTSSYEKVEELLDTAWEMRTILLMESDFPVSGYTDIRKPLAKIKIEGTHLEPEELLLLYKALLVCREIATFFSRKEPGSYPHLYRASREVQLLPFITERIDKILDRFAEVKDTASPELGAIRRALSEKEQQAGRRLQSILRMARSEGIVEEDATISIRDGRAVIPVLSSNKRKLKGLVHDESATGKTVYIEPVEVVELNNAIKELEYEERREIVRILTEFTSFIRPYLPDLAMVEQFIVEIDFLVAKSKVSLSMHATRPILRKDQHLMLRNARHPLLEDTLSKEGKKIVPLNLILSREKHILVISGPNAGGKSVCLKCVGLLQYMLQCGLLIPVNENSEIGIFDDVFIDIGDQQSLDNDLSTYSSHLQNMKTMLRHSSRKSLVLIDEFGTGTEPTMGGAIAETILQRLEQRGVFGVITTHYSNLKYYANNAPGIINGAMTFDIQNIQPLFALEMGKPGSSFALEIARKIGLPEDVIATAKEKIGTDQVNIEKQLREIARDKRYWENKRDKIRLAEKRAQELSDRYESELSALLGQRKELITAAKQQAKEILSQTNKRIEHTIQEIREAQAEKEKTKKIRENITTFSQETLHLEATSDEDRRIERKIEQLRQRQLRKQEKKPENKTTTDLPIVREITIGDKVRIKGQEIIGEVRSVSPHRCSVAFGQWITQVDRKRLEFISNNEYKRQQKELSESTKAIGGNFQPQGKGYNLMEKRLAFKSEIDLRGTRVEEALIRAQELVDEAFMLGIGSARILHGKGTGALKEEIRRYLKTIPFVASCKDEHEQFGGSGITIITLDIDQ